MLFNSLSFIIFFPVVCLIYWLLPRQKMRVWFLTLASFYFYMSWKPIFGILLLACIAITYIGVGISCWINSKYKKAVASVVVVTNIGILVFYKYFNFLAESVTAFMQSLGLHMSVPGFDILLPLGISFFTFKAISYIIDVYKGKMPAEKDFMTFAAYLSFFPQLIAGPIDRATNLIPQLKRKVEFDGRLLTTGAKMMLWGYFMKVVFANRACIYVDAIYGNLEHHNGTSVLLAAVLYSLQIYCDFAGYSLISIGCAKAMGYNVPDNFVRPYFAVSITEFWKRWHISLTKWLTEYVYFPLGGNRCSKVRNYMNIMLVFLVSGLWHGAAWNFVIWGAMHGVIQIIEKWMGIAKRECKSMVERIGRTVTTFILATLAWIFFRLPNFMEGVEAVTKIFTPVGKPFAGRDAMPALEFCLLAFVFLLFKDWTDEYCPDKYKLLNNKNIVVRYAAYIGLSLIILMCGVFDDSQFIYAQF